MSREIGIKPDYSTSDRIPPAGGCSPAYDRALELCATCLDDNDREVYIDAKRLAKL